MIDTTIHVSEAVTLLSALAQPHRLTAFRLLVAAEPDGLSAGDLAREIGIPPAGLSFHLSHLGHAGLVTSVRKGRRIVYRANFSAMRELLNYLTSDCCGGRPEICGDLFGGTQCAPMRDDHRIAGEKKR